jgi:hypothetical protein
MRQRQAVLLAVLTGALGGCLPARTEPAPAGYDVRRAFPGPTGEDVVQIDVAQVERLPGDRFINHELWELADEQGVSLERKPVLEANGFRVCQLGGVPPAGLQALLTSVRSCPDPHHLQLRAGTAAPVLLGAPWRRCRFELHQEGREVPVDLEEAQCLLEVVPRLGEDGRTVLTFTPHVRHGREQVAPRPQQDAAGSLRWGWDARQPDEAYPWLEWELTVSPNEYVVVGTVLDRPGTLGHRCFLHEEGRRRVQRLLVIRTAPGSAPAGPRDESSNRAPPLALQASWTSARGSRD